MKTIYCISGLGADERAFSKLKINGFELKVIKWLMPLPGESLSNYATRMQAGITTENPILLGLSFGGMVCTEIAKQIPVQKIIIISSIKSSKELPRWMKTVAKLRLNRVVPLRSTILTQPFQNLVLGVETTEEKVMVESLRKEADLPYITWAVDQALNWKNEWQHPSVYQIHGDNDHMFPIKNIKPTYTVKGGGHFMIMNRADEVSGYINTILHQLL